MKLRAFEILLVLFHVEDLKDFVISSLESSDRLNRVPGHRARRRRSKEVWGLLVDWGVISVEERREIEALVDYRNVIAHELHRLTDDVGPWAGQFRIDKDPEFQSFALPRVKWLRAKIAKGMSRTHIVVLSSRSLMFEAAERTFTGEIDRLELKIRKQVRVLREEIDVINRNLESIPKALLEELEIGHPKHTRRNGTLSADGRACCDRLFLAGATPLAVAHLLRVSLRSATHHYRQWQLTRTSTRFS